MSTGTATFFCNRCGWRGTGPADANGVEHGGCHYAAYKVPTCLACNDTGRVSTQAPGIYGPCWSCKRVPPELVQT